jgi:hypothetical protein
MGLLQCTPPSLIGSTYHPSTHRHRHLELKTIRLHQKSANILEQRTLGAQWRNGMDLIHIAVLLLHPLLATGLLGWIWWQYSWRKKSHDLKGEPRKKALSQHEKYGNWLIWSAFFVICVAFSSRAFIGWRENKSFVDALEPSLHGFMGPIGFVLLFLLARMGRQARDARNEGEKFTHHALKHGRAADLIVALAFIHAFLGFLQIFKVL